MSKTTCPRCGSLEIVSVSLATIDSLGETMEGYPLYKFCNECGLSLLEECWYKPERLNVVKAGNCYFVEDYVIPLDQYSVVSKLRLPYNEEGRIIYALSKIAKTRKVEELTEFLAEDEGWIRKLAQERFEELGGRINEKQ